MSAEDVEQQIRRHPTANERFLLGFLDEARAKVTEADRVLPDCQKNADMNFKPECYVLHEPEPCWACQVRAVLIGYDRES